MLSAGQSRRWFQSAANLAATDNDNPVISLKPSTYDSQDAGAFVSGLRFIYGLPGLLVGGIAGLTVAGVVGTLMSWLSLF